MTGQTTPSGAAPEILIVEDSPVEAELLRRILVRAGYRVPAVAKNGAEGLQALREHPCTLVMSDINMPLMDGYELCRAIKLDEKLWSIPVILVTILSEPKDIIRALDAGADGYITKPYVENVLLGRIRALLANPLRRKLAEERRRIPVEYDGERHDIAAGPQMVNLLLSVYENSLTLNNELMHIQNQLNLLNETLEEKVQQRTAALQEYEDKFRAIFEGIQDGILLADAKTRRFAGGNPAICRMLGYSLEEIMQLGVADIHPQQALPNVVEQFERQLRGEIDLAADIPVKRKDGSLFHADINSSPLSFGGRDYLLGIFHDITERKQAALILRESEARFRALVDAAGDLIFTVDATGKVGYVNEMAARALQSTPEEVAGKNLRDLSPPEIFERQWSNLQRVFDSGKPLYAEEPTRFPRGDIWQGTWLTPLRDESGAIANVLGASRDITERKQAEAKILETQAELQRLLDAANQSRRALLSVIEDQKLADAASQHANRALAALSAVNSNLVHATDENELLQAVCNAIVKQKGYRLAWVGYKQHDESKSIRIMARAGHDEGYLDAMQLSWAETGRGMGPGGRAIRSSATQVSQDIANDPLFLPWRDAALQRGYAACIALPLLNGDSTVFGILHVYSAQVNDFTPGEVALLEEMAEDLAFGVLSLHTRQERDLALEQNQRQLLQLQDSLEDTVRAMAGLVEMRDPYTAGHQARVADLAAAIARQMGLPDEQAHAIHLAGTVHDLGKIYIPAEVLSKPGKITDIDFNLIKTHPQAGHDILQGIDFPWPIAQMVFQHHERLDGSGYPQGLKGEGILLEARILSVADTVEAMSSHRPYRPGFGLQAALAEITRLRGTKYDPAVVDACLCVISEKGFVFK